MNRLRMVWTDHPALASWALLAAGMVVILVIAAKDVGFQPGQWTALIVATIALAGLCVWIIGWEDDDRQDDETAPDHQESVQ
jgi:hypothetical protein